MPNTIEIIDGLNAAWEFVNRSSSALCGFNSADSMPVSQTWDEKALEVRS